MGRGGMGGLLKGGQWPWQQQKRRGDPKLANNQQNNKEEIAPAARGP